MAFTLDPFFPASLKTNSVLIQPADTTTKKTIYTAGSNGGKVVALFTSSDDSATEDLQIWLTISSTDYLLATKTIAITAGFVTGTPAFNWFDGIQNPGFPIDRDGQRYILMPAAGILKVSSKATVTVAKTLYTTAMAYDF